MSIVLENKRNIRILTHVGAGGFMCLGFFYLVLLNDLSTSGFDLQAQRVEATKIGRMLEKIDAEISTPESLYALEHSVQVQEMVEVETKKYKVLSVEQGVAYVPIY